MRLQRLLRPEVAFSSVYFLFIAFAYAGYAIEGTRRFLVPAFGGIHTTSVVITLLGIALVSASAWFAERYEAEVRLNPELLLPVMGGLTLFALQAAFPEQPALNAAIALGSIAFWLGFVRYGSLTALLAGSYALALLAAGLTLSQGVPIVEAVFRESVAVSPERAVFHGLAVLSASLLVLRAPWRVSLPSITLLVVLGVLSGFKSDAIAVIMSGVIAGLLSGRVSLKALIPAIAAVGVILTAVSTQIASVSYSSWKIPPHLYVFYRAGFTYSVFDRVVQLSLPWGLLHGSALTDVSQVITSTVVLGYEKEHIITSTLFGPAVLDFGIAGLVAVAVLLGLYLGVMHRLAGTLLGTASYAVALTHVLILIEVGLQPTSVLFLLTLLYLSLSAEEVEA